MTDQLRVTPGQPIQPPERGGPGVPIGSGALAVDERVGAKAGAGVVAVSAGAAPVRLNARNRGGSRALAILGRQRLKARYLDGVAPLAVYLGGNEHGTAERVALDVVDAAGHAVTGRRARDRGDPVAVGTVKVGDAARDRGRLAPDVIRFVDHERVDVSLGFRIRASGGAVAARGAGHDADRVVKAHVERDRYRHGGASCRPLRFRGRPGFPDPPCWGY